MLKSLSKKVINAILISLGKLPWHINLVPGTGIASFQIHKILGGNFISSKDLRKATKIF